MVSGTIRHYSVSEDGLPVRPRDQCNLEFTEKIYNYDWEDAKMMEVTVALPSYRISSHASDEGKRQVRLQDAHSVAIVQERVYKRSDTV